MEVKELIDEYAREALEAKAREEALTSLLGQYGAYLVAVLQAYDADEISFDNTALEKAAGHVVKVEPSPEGDRVILRLSADSLPSVD